MIQVGPSSRRNQRAREDYEAMMKTGVVCRKRRWIGGKEGYEVDEYEIDTGAIEALNSIEKRAAVETGQMRSAFPCAAVFRSRLLTGQVSLVPSSGGCCCIG
jgi:hypothetical protein